MLNQNQIMAIQQVMDRAYVNHLVARLHLDGYSDARPFHQRMHLGLQGMPVPIDVHMSVCTKAPPEYIPDYHVWIRPLSGEVFLGTVNGFQHIDFVYETINGGNSSYVPPVILDDIKNWV